MPQWARSLAGGLLAALEQETVPDVNAPRRVADQLGQWAAHLSRSAVLVWAPYLLKNEGCSFCNEDALGACIGCGDPCCTGHAHVSHRAELVCDECIENKVLNRIQPKKRDKVHLAFEYFNVLPGVAFEEITAIYRIRSQQAHPDRGGNHDQMTRLNQHYDVLKSHFKKRAA